MNPSIGRRSSVVEHTLGKGEVMGSSPIGGFKRVPYPGVPDRVDHGASVIDECMTLSWA